MIKAEHLHKRYEKVHAVNDVSIEARRGEIFGLLGPNGAGKSTTIRMITSIIQPDSGTITYDGNEFSDAIRNRIGYLAEERGLYQKARILETILHFARLKGMDDRTARTNAARWLERFEVAGAQKRKVEELSKGNQQKVQIIIALVHDPEYLVLDEPATGLDPVNQEILRDVIDEMRAAGRTILYSTHQMDLAERICNQIALIDRGRVVLAGTVEEVRRSHAGNNVLVEFEGDGSFLRSIPPVASADIYPNYAELKLKSDASLDDILPHLGGRLRISKIERVRPTLNAIFIETVSRRGEGVSGGGGEGETEGRREDERGEELKRIQESRNPTINDIDSGLA
jgi:ABC-2 type transport system ATP-binding protein